MVLLRCYLCHLATCWRVFFFFLSKTVERNQRKNPPHDSDTNITQLIKASVISLPSTDMFLRQPRGKIAWQTFSSIGEIEYIVDIACVQEVRPPTFIYIYMVVLPYICVGIYAMISLPLLSLYCSRMIYDVRKLF